MEWTSRIITISIEMVVPALLGHWADRKLGTRVVFVLIGAIAGMTLGLWHLLQITAAPPSKDRDKGPPEKPEL